jgi:anti-anti-sigma factor
MAEFEFTVTPLESCQLVRVGGELASDTTPWLERELDQLAAWSPVVIDLSRVKSLTSTGVQALLRERSFGLPVLFCRPGTSVARVLEIVQAHRLVPIYSDLAAAIRSHQAETTRRSRPKDET